MEYQRSHPKSEIPSGDEHYESETPKVSPTRAADLALCVPGE
jgi:hypothetical protein